MLPAMYDDTENEQLEDFKVRFNKLLNDEDKYLPEIAACIKLKDEKKVNYALDKLSGLGKTESLSGYTENEGESLLHITVKYYDNDDLVSKLLELCPGLLLKGRESSDSYRGQTALHIALTKGNEKVVRKMVQGEKLKGSLPKLLETKAIGKMFVNTVMMGELPLAVAFLKFDPVLVELLLDSGANLHAKNSHGDSILHTLVKYAAIHPEKVQQVKEMFTLINSKSQKPQKTIKEDPDHYSYLWFLQNNDHLTPLQLAAMHGVSELFEFILNLKDVYYIVSGHDGLFDVKMYDITEIDNSTYLKSKSDPLSSCFKNSKVDPDKEDLSSRSLDTASTELQLQLNESNLVETESVLEMLFSRNYHSKDAYRIIELLPIKSIVKLKWAKYRCLFCFWFLLHLAVMILLTVYSVQRATYFSQVEMGNSTDRPREQAIHITRWIFLLYGILYGAIAVSVGYTKYKTHNARRYIFHNLEYIILLVAFAVTIIIDTSMGVQLNTHNSEALIVALICGWWFGIFFLRPFYRFSFFTVLIKKVILGDMPRFALVISFNIFAFAAGMHILFRGVSDADDFQTYPSSLIPMFKLGIGIADIEVLYVARVPWLAVTLFVLFVILTYLLMINALIAMMSQTCALVSQEPFPQWRVQQLSVILFLENILSLPCLRRFLSSLGEPNTKKGKRYFLKIHSLQMEYASEEDKEMVERRKSSDLRKYISKIVKQQSDDRPQPSRIHKSQRTLEFVDGGLEIVVNNKTTQIKPLSGYRFVRTRNRKRKHMRRRSI